MIASTAHVCWKETRQAQLPPYSEPVLLRASISAAIPLFTTYATCSLKKAFVFGRYRAYMLHQLEIATPLDATHICTRVYDLGEYIRCPTTPLERLFHLSVSQLRDVMLRAALDRCGEFVDACAVRGEIFKFSVSQFTEAKLQLPEAHNGLSSNVCVAVVVLQQKGVRFVAHCRSNGDKSVAITSSCTS